MRARDQNESQTPNTRFYLWLWISGPASPQLKQWMQTVGCKQGGTLPGNGNGAGGDTAAVIARSMPVFWRSGKFRHCSLGGSECDAARAGVFQPQNHSQTSYTPLDGPL
jgi:hypothetical protein